MRTVTWIPFVALASALAVSQPSPPVPEVKTFPSTTRKDSLVTRIRYGPHSLKKAVVSRPKKRLKDVD